MAAFEYVRSLPLTTVSIITLLLYAIGLVIQRLYLSPISKLPGPKLAAATWWYEFYHDVVRGGQYVFKLQELHEKYGAVVPLTDTKAGLIIQDPSSGLILMSSMFEILTSMRFSTVAQASGVTSGHGRLTCSVTPSQVLVPLTTTITDYAETR
jgi:hypothetical protein